MPNQSPTAFHFGGQRIPLGRYTLENRYKFTTGPNTYFFGDREVPRNTEAEFWETANFGWLQWTGQDGVKHLAKY